jgi:hypothetical protein
VRRACARALRRANNDRRREQCGEEFRCLRITFATNASRRVFAIAAIIAHGDFMHAAFDDFSGA